MIEQQTISRTEFDECIERIDRLRELKPNWDSYGASSIDPFSIEAAKKVVALLSRTPEIAAPRIDASRDGLVVLSWESHDFKRELDVEVQPEVLCIGFLDEEHSERDAECETTDINEIVRFLLKL